MALDYLHNDPVKNAQLVVDWYSTRAFKMNTFTIQDLMPSTSYAYPFISHRVLYPLLSVPFVALFGLSGMLAVPAISLLMLMLSIQYISYRKGIPLIGFALVFTFSNSITVIRWMIVNTTDSLLAGLFALVMIQLFNLKNNINRSIAILGILIILTSATRFVLPVWIAICAVLLLRKIYRKYAGLLLGLSTFAAIPALNAQLSTSLLPGEGENPTYLKILKLPISFVRVVGIDVLQSAVLDRFFLILILSGVIVSVKNRKLLSSQLFISILFACYLLGAINGTLGVNFRYQMPVLAFCAWVLVDWISSNRHISVLRSSMAGDVKIEKT
jgi:hypothetical protein